MTSQEEQMLNSLIERVNSTQLSEKDTDAAKLLQEGFASNPDAMYILAQSVLVQNIALEQAHAQLTAAQEKLNQQPPKATSFLSGLLHRTPRPQPQAAPTTPYEPVYSPQATEYQTPQYQNVPNPAPYPGPNQGQPYQAQPYQGQPYPAQGYAPPQYGPGMYPPPMGGMGGGGMFGGGSFLRGAAQTAAGVAAGALAFEGVEALLHGGFGHPGMGYGMGGWGMPGIGMGMGPGMMGGGMMGMGGMGFERPIEENIVTNNYYEEPGGGFERGGEHHFHESGMQNDGNLADASWTEGAGDSGSGFDSGYDSGSGGDSGFGDFGGGGGDFGGGDSGGGGGDLL